MRHSLLSLVPLSIYIFFLFSPSVVRTEVWRSRKIGSSGYRIYRDLDGAPLFDIQPQKEWRLLHQPHSCLIERVDSPSKMIAREHVRQFHRPWFSFGSVGTMRYINHFLNPFRTFQIEWMKETFLLERTFTLNEH